MKRMLCLLLVLVLLLSMCVQAFADEDVLYCRMCGKRIPADSKVCSYCGVKVVHVEDDAKESEKNTDSDTKEAPKPEAAAAPAAAPAPTSPAPVPAPAEPVQAQSTLSSPVTQAAASPVPGPFHTTIGANNTLQGHVYVTKSPTSESVPYGGSCMFIAHAANATSVTWYIANSDASLITTVAEAPNRVSGLSVSGANSDTLVLYGIPSYMNGCQVQARFDGEGGPVYTDIARIWTYQPAQEYNTSDWTWWDWFNYYYRNDPYHWDYPWDWYYYWVNNPHNAPFWFKPSQHDHDFDLNPYPPVPKPASESKSQQTALILGKNTKGQDEQLLVEKNDNSQWDIDYLRRLWDYYSGKDEYPYGRTPTNSDGNTGTGNTGTGNTGTGNTGSSSGSTQNNSSQVTESWVDTDVEAAYGDFSHKEQETNVIETWVDTDKEMTLEDLQR